MKKKLLVIYNNILSMGKIVGAGCGVGVINIYFSLQLLVLRKRLFIFFFITMFWYFVLDPSTFKVFAMEKFDHDLLENVRIATIDQRLEGIRHGSVEEQQRFLRELTRIAGTLVDNVEPISLREQIVGYESLILWATLSVILFITTRYWVEIRDFLFQVSQTILQSADQTIINTIDFERIRALTFELYSNPRTQDAILELISRGEAS